MAVEVNERDLVRLTGIWKRKTKDGREYFAGSISRTANVYLFPSRQREGNRPEFILYFGQSSPGDSPERE
jgi:hypothetical protein